MKANPGITVKFESFAVEQYATVLSTALAAGKGGDVIHTRAYGGLEQFAKAGNWAVFTFNPYGPNTSNPFEAVPSPAPPSRLHWLGTDSLGRDVYARMIYGARISLLVGLSVALISVVSGAVVGLLAGYFSRFDAIIMRLMDGIMAIPSILLAIALVALLGSSVKVVIIAIAIPEIPRVTRLVRAVVLSVRDLPFVEAARSNGTRVAKLLRRHILPSTVAPLIVQATYICASAILTEAGLSFLGAGTPPEFPTWGNMIASSRAAFSAKASGGQPTVTSPAPTLSAPRAASRAAPRDGAVSVAAKAPAPSIRTRCAFPVRTRGIF